MKRSVIALTIILLISCKDKSHEVATSIPEKELSVTNGGATIQFQDTTSAAYFKVDLVKKLQLSVPLTAPGRIVATVVPSLESSGDRLILFDNPDLTSNYTSLLQHLINIRTYSSNLARLKDLAKNGAATGRDVIEAENLLANEKAGILEHEAKLKLAGLDPQALMQSKANSVWAICDIPETQLSNIRAGLACSLRFSSFPERDFIGKVEDTGNIVDPVTRMVKVRIGVDNSANLLKAGMFATMIFQPAKTTWLAVPREAVVTVQGKYYAFVRSDNLTFERREIQTGDQVQDQLIIFGGLKEGEQVVLRGTMQLKGISFGY